MNLKNPIDRVMHLQWIKDRLLQQTWEHVTPHQANGGLWGGELADFQRTKAIHTRMPAEFRIDEANALRAIVTHTTCGMPLGPPPTPTSRPVDVVAERMV